MAKIKNTTAYPTVAPAANDLIIGTDVSDNKKTVTFLVSSLGGGGGVPQDLNSVLGVGNTSALNIELNGNASALGSSISVIDIFPTTISAGGLGSIGTAGQVLSSTGTGIAWIAAPGTNQSWNDTLAVSPVATANPNLTGTFTIQTGGGLSLLGNSTLSVSGTSIFYSNVTLSDGVDLKVSDQSQIGIDDGTGTYVYGTPGQFLSATANGLAWTSSPSLVTPTLQQVVTAGNTLLNSSIVFTGTGGITLSGTNTITGQGVINFNGNGTPTTSATQGRLIISQGSISLSGANSQILLSGSPGAAGQVLTSNGPFTTPTWQAVSGGSLNLQQVLDNGNTATQNINLTGDINLTGGGLKLAANAFIELNTDRGTLGQVLISGGPAGFPTWATAGTGSVTAVNVSDTTYIDMSVDVTAPATPIVSSQLITTGTVATGPGGLTTAFYDDNTTGTNYAIASGLTTTALTGSGSGIIVNITNTTAGNVVLADLSFTSGGSGYASGDTFRVNQSGSDNNLVIEVDAIATETYYDQTGRFSTPKGADWDLTVTNVGNIMTITNSDGNRSSSFTLQGNGGAVFTNAGSNNIELDFSSSGTGTVQSISLTDSTGAAGTAITSSGTFTFAEQAATSTYLRTTSAVTGTTITLSTETPTIQAVASVGGTLLNKALTIQNSDGTTNNSFVLGTTAAPSIATAGQILAFNSTNGGYMEWVPQAAGGNMTSWNIGATNGAAGAVTDGQTVTIAAGAAINTQVDAATRVVTITNMGVRTLNNLAGLVTLNGSANTIVGNNTVSGVTITSAGLGYSVNNYYETTKLVSALSGAQGCVFEVTAVGAGGSITAGNIYGVGKNWTVGDTMTVNTGSTLAVLTVSSVTSVGTLGITTWRGISGTPSSDTGDYTVRSLPYFQSKQSIYSSKIYEYDGKGTGTFTEVALTLGDFSLSPKNGQQINIEGDIGFITTKSFPNIRIGNSSNAFQSAAQSNIAIGGNTMIVLTTGDSNIAMGYAALQDINTGTQNIAIGQNVYGSGIGANRNIRNSTAIGYGAADRAYGSYDTIIGSAAGQNMINTTATPGTQEQMNRVAIGYQAMIGQSTSATTGRRYNKGDVAIGNGAAAYQSTSNTLSTGASVYIGQSAGKGIPNNTALQSVFRSGYQTVIGGRAMGNGAGAREGYIAIGYEASVGSTTLNIDTINSSTKGIAIGFQAEGTEASADTISRSGVGNIAIGVIAGGMPNTNVEGATIAIGTSAMAEGTNTIAMGQLSRAGDAGKIGSIALGMQAEAQFDYSIAIGRDATATGANQFVVGSTAHSAGTTATETIAASDSTWTVKINGQDYKIPMLAV